MAEAASVALSLVSSIEAGRLIGVRFGDYAAVVSAAITYLQGVGWAAYPEVSYSIFGERGSIDVLGARPVEHAAIVEEVKSEIGSLEGTIRKLDEKSRLARERICAERLGWSPAVVGRLLVLPDADAARRAVDRHAAILDPAFPARGRAIRHWLQAPSGPMSGILFVPVARPVGSAGATDGGTRSTADIARGDHRARQVGVTRVRPPGTTAKRRAHGA